MTKLQEHLYQYITEDRYANLTADEGYLLARRRRNEAQEKLTENLSKGQKKLFERYVAEENRVSSLELRHIFHETLQIVHDILNVSL